MPNESPLPRPVQATIAELKSILDSEQRRRSILAEELTTLQDKFGDNRRSRIIADEGDLSLEDLIADEELVVGDALPEIGRLDRRDPRLQGVALLNFGNSFPQPRAVVPDEVIQNFLGLGKPISWRSSSDDRDRRRLRARKEEGPATSPGLVNGPLVSALIYEM